MAQNQRQAIVDSVNGPMLEWGCGGTTLWLLQRISQPLTSIEHHPEWFARVHGECKQFRDWTGIYAPGEAGENATPWEENPAALDGYINAADLGRFGCFLIDGVARGACLANVLLNAKSGSRIFLHDFHRDWYGWIVHAGRNRLCDTRIIEADQGDYPPPLWSATLK
jgi:hypothetical protein